jgi:hypothetical protein
MSSVRMVSGWASRLELEVDWIMVAGGEDDTRR